MKKNLKLMTAAMSLVALASCTDDLNVNGSQNGVYGKDDFVATLQTDEALTRFAMQEESDKVKGGSKKVVWSDQDQIRVFTLDKLSQDLYEIKSGAGEATAVFQRIADSGLTGEKYAITEATMIYGISATRVDGKDLPLLTVTLPGEYTVGEDAQGNKNFPVPYWGKVTSMSGTDANTNISASFTGLAAFLRVGAKELPKGTKAIVLTTHGGVTNDGEEGFQLSPTFPVDASGDPIDVQDDGSGYGWAQTTLYPYTTGGKSEALTGTLNAVLDPSKDRNDVFLTVDDRLVKSDTLRVNLTGTSDQIFYIPILVGTYENLHVIAVTGDSKYSYTWVGTELKNFKKEEFKNNKAYYLDLNMLNFAKADYATINKTIKEKNTTAGLTTVINVDELVTDDGVDNGTFDNTKIQLSGAGNVALSLEDMTAITADMTIEETAKAAFAGETPTFELNIDEAFTKNVTITSPYRKVIVGTFSGANAATSEITITGSADKFVSGLDLYENVVDGKMMNEKNAAITIKNGFPKVTVEEGTDGDIFVFTDGQEETEVDELIINSTSNNDVRLSDALVAALKIEDAADGNRNIFTTGSAAMKTVTKVSSTGYPKNTAIESYYTGAGLSDYAYSNGYDQKEIYTVAQLQSMGEKSRPSGVTTSKTDGEYIIPDAIVGHFWLGSVDFPWIGPRVDWDDFVLDGDNAKLMNLYVETSGADELIDDPHYCCTSCGGPASAHIPMGNDLGLIRSIENSAAATVKNVNLNDVLIKVEKKVTAITDKEAINNIGSIVGNVSIAGDFTFTGNDLGEVKIEGNGQKVGGMIGNLQADGGKLIIENNTSKSTQKTGGYVKSDFDYVGGLIGYAEGAAVTLNNNLVKMQNNVEAGKGYAAGMIGSLKSTANVSAANNKVEIQDITAVESYAAGLVGNLEAATYGVFAASDVKAKNISTDNMYAGGLIGQAQMGASNALALRDSKVNVETELAAEEGQVGGLLGNIKQASNVYVNQNDASKNQNTTITLAKLTGAYAAGGVLGSNDSGIGFVLYTGHTEGTGAKTNAVTVTVTDYFNPKSATYYVGSDTYKYGTMQSIIGFKQGDVTIYTDKLTAANNLTDAKKKAVFYQAHPDDHHTYSVGEYYWGDTNNYVGFGDTGKYWLNASANYNAAANVLQKSEQEDGYNHFKAY